MNTSNRDPVSELVERAREARRSEQPPTELIEAALGRLAREELSRERSGIFSPVRLGPVPFGLALALALAVIVSWGARRYTALDPHQYVPGVALTAEPVPLRDATLLPELADHGEHPGGDQPSTEPPRALLAAPTPLPPVPDPARAEVRAARGQSTRDGRQSAGPWTVVARDEALRPSPTALRQLPDHRQCIDVTGNQRFTLGLQGGPGRQGFALAQGQRYRLILPRVSVTGPQLKLTAFVGSSEKADERPLLSNVVSSPSPSTVGMSFEPRRDDARAPVGILVDATDSFGTSQLCLGAPRVEMLGEQSEADVVAESYELGEGKPSTEKKSGRKKQNGKRERKPTRPLEPSCNPSWYLDAQGIRRAKPNCL